MVEVRHLEIDADDVRVGVAEGHKGEWRGEGRGATAGRRERVARGKSRGYENQFAQSMVAHAINPIRRANFSWDDASNGALEKP